MKNKIDKKTFISFLVFITNYSCNLRCKDCANFVPYLPEEKKRCFSFEEIKQDMDILESFVFVNRLQFQGGEPLLHKELDKIIIYAVGLSSIKNITISTNGTILLNEKLLKVCKDNNVLIRISNYGKINQQKVSKLISQCKKYDIQFQTYNMARGTEKEPFWCDLGGLDTPKNCNDLEVTKIYASCCFRKCYTLSEGLLTKCSRSPVGHMAGVYPFFPQDFVNIRKEKDMLKLKIQGFIADEKFMECCRYCNGTKDKIKPAIQL